ncbi:helix-turn-helix domain-containing protein [[Eubacterium] hominis]|uniref:helix-turn-helix domain-containing protein n=1 Tax=[Eubacterium] hominis TaxID=2764325 RepID=UPI003A4E38F5
MQDIVAIYKEEACIDFVKVGKRIQEVRKKKKMTQACLASICGCSNNHLSAIETGLNKISTEMIMKISIALEKKD